MKFVSNNIVNRVVPHLQEFQLVNQESLKLSLRNAVGFFKPLIYGVFNLIFFKVFHFSFLKQLLIFFIFPKVYVRCQPGRMSPW